MDKLFSSEALIRFSDCDPLGHLNNQRYLDYFLNAREDQLKSYLDFDIYKYAGETGYTWVMFQNQITYLRPVFHNHIVILTSQLLELGDKSLHIEMQMKDSKSEKIYALLWMVAVHIKIDTGKSAPHPAFITNMMEGLIMPSPQASYNERVSALQSAR